MELSKVQIELRPSGRSPEHTKSRNTDSTAIYLPCDFVGVGWPLDKRGNQE